MEERVKKLEERIEALELALQELPNKLKEQAIVEMNANYDYLQKTFFSSNHEKH